MDESFLKTGPGAEAPSGARMIGPYRVVRELGRGGMGAVYLCEDTAVGDRPVALKVVLDLKEGGADALERFKREIRHLGALRHRNIVQVLFAGEHEGRPYFVMEYVPGRDLNRRLEELADLPEPRRIAEIVRLMVKVCEGVAHAHRAGTTHRDLKPQNILVREDGEPMILDFGIAKHREDASITSGGHAPGTPAFMAPEQFDAGLTGEEAQIDVWGLGAVLYVALTRDRPFKGPSLASVAYHVVHTTPIAPRKLNPAIPERLEAVVLKALEKDPRRRYASVDLLREALLGAAAAGERSERRRRAGGVVAALLAACVLGVAFWRPWERTTTAADATATLLRVEGRPISFDRRVLDVASADPTFVVALDGVRRGAILEAVLEDSDGRVPARVPLAPAGGAYEAAFRLPAEARREGLGVGVRIFADGRPIEVRPAACRFTLDAVAPRVSARAVMEGAEPAARPLEDDAPTTLPLGAVVEIRAEDPGGVSDAECAVDGVLRAPPAFDREPLRLPCDAPGERVIVVRVRDGAGNETVRTLRLAIAPKGGAASSRSEGPATRASVRTSVLDLPDVPGVVEKLGATTDFSRPAPLEPRDNVSVVVRNALGPFELDWRLRLIDDRGEVVAQCRLEPVGLLGGRTWTSVSGRLDLAGARPTPPLRAEFVLRDAAERVVTRRLDLRLDWRTTPTLAPRPRVKFDLAYGLSYGSFVVELDRAAAPQGVTTFLAVVESGFFSDTVLHDVVRDASVSGGRYTVSYAVKPVPATIPAAPNEFDRPGALRNVAGTVALAFGADKDSARAQFVVNLADQPDLDAAKFTVIGRIVEGHETLRAVSALAVQRRQTLARTPKENVTVKTATVLAE